jgi:hypothetical protein
MFDSKQRGLIVVDSCSNMPENEKAVKCYVSLVCSIIHSRFAGRAMQLLKTYRLFQPSNESENREICSQSDHKNLIQYHSKDHTVISSLLCELTIFRRWVNTKPTS